MAQQSERACSRCDYVSIFMKVDDPNMRGMACKKGPMHGFKDARDAIETIQGRRCLLCAAPISDLHHIVPTSKGGMKRPQNYAGFCKACHDAMHKDIEAAKALGQLKKRTKRKPAGASILNQIRPSLLEHLNDTFKAKKCTIVQQNAGIVFL